MVLDIHIHKNTGTTKLGSPNYIGHHVIFKGNVIKMVISYPKVNLLVAEDGLTAQTGQTLKLFHGIGILFTRHLNLL